MKRKSIILLLLILVWIVIFIFIGVVVGSFKIQDEDTRKTPESDNEVSEEIDAPIYHDDGSVTIPEGSMSNGFYDSETNKIIDGGSVIRLSEDTLQGKIRFQQNFPVENEYLLIVLIDYAQHEFEIEGKRFQSYSFSLEGESTIELNISVHLMQSEGIEFSYVIIPEPGEQRFLVDGEYNWNTMFSTREWIVSRFGLEREHINPEKKPEYAQNYTEFHAEGNISGFELVGSRDDLIVSVEEKGGEMIELVMLNQELDSEDTDYVILGFLNWQQIPIDGEYMQYYVTVPANSSISIPVILPKVEEDAVLQIIAFKISDAGIEQYTITTKTTFRVLVKP